MMHKLILWLALCGLVASGRLLEAGRTFEPPARLLGITFSVPDASSSSSSSSEERRQPSESELRRALLQTEPGMEMEERARVRQLANKEELQRRARLNRILDAIGASLAPAPAPLAAQQQAVEPGAGSQAPLHRSGRIYPTRETAATNENFRNFRFVGSGGDFPSANAVESSPRSRLDSAEQWEPSMLDGASSSAKSQRSSAIKGLVWPSNRPITSGGSPPFYTGTLGGGGGPLRQHAGGSDGGPQASTIYGANQQRTRSGLLVGGSAARPQHHRVGSAEEVALQTPVHSRSQNDYEWKRVEQSRWNNLRGMWGKRAAMRDDEDPAEKYKELIEWEAQREASERAGEQIQDTDQPGPDSKARLDDNQRGAPQQQQRQSVSSM